MKKILVIGCPGAGKSTFARRLKEKLQLPLYYLDMLYWNADKTTVSRDVFDSRLYEVLKNEEWIIDGNYNRTLETRLKYCDTVFFLDFPKSVCLDGAVSRVGQKREEMPWVETEIDTEFLKFIENFDSEIRPNVLNLLQKYNTKNVITLHSRKELDDILENISLT